MELQSCEMKLLLFLLLLLPLVSCVSNKGSADGFRQKEARVLNKLELVLRLIFTRTCAANNMSIFVSTEYKELLARQEQRLVDRVLDKVLPRRSLDAQVPILMDKKLRRQLNLQIQLMIFFVSNTQQFIASHAGNAGATATHKHKFLVVMLAKGEQAPLQLHDQMSQLFSYMLHERYNIDVLLLLAQLQHDTLKSYNFYPFGAKTNPACESTEPTLVSLHEARLEQLYPQKLQNLHGCPLHVIVWDIPPYMQVHRERRTVEEQLEGWDAELLQLLAQKLNFQPSLMQNEPPELIGGQTPMNGSFTGAYRMLRQRRANLTLGCTACLPARAKYLSNTVSYNQVEYVIVLRESSAYSYYELMLFPFQGSTWLLLLGLAMLRLLCRYIACCRMPCAPIRLGWIMLIFVLRTGYEGSIFEFVHNAPVRPLPHTYEQALLDNYSFIMDHATYRMVGPLPKLKPRSRPLPGLPVDMFEQLLRLPQDSRTALFTSRDFLAYHLMQHREQRHRFVVLEQKILNNILCMHFPLGSYLAHIISDLLFDLRSFGICQQLTKIPRWSRPAVTTSPRARPLSQAPKSSFAESMQFLHAAFYCLLFAESLILCVFLLELLTLHPYFRWLHWLFLRH